MVGLLLDVCGSLLEVALLRMALGFSQFDFFVLLGEFADARDEVLVVETASLALDGDCPTFSVRVLFLHSRALLFQASRMDLDRVELLGRFLICLFRLRRATMQVTYLLAVLSMRILAGATPSLSCSLASFRPLASPCNTPPLPLTSPSPITIDVSPDRMKRIVSPWALSHFSNVSCIHTAIHAIVSA